MHDCLTIAQLLLAHCRQPDGWRMVTMNFLWVAEGHYACGDQEVTVFEPYWIAESSCSDLQWRAVMTHGHIHDPAARVAFCNRLNGRVEGTRLAPATAEQWSCATAAGIVIGAGSGGGYRGFWIAGAWHGLPWMTAYWISPGESSSLTI